MPEEPATTPEEPATTPVAETPEPSAIDEKIDAIFKALADLQSAVKDLAVSISSSAEAQKGVNETLTKMKEELLNTIKEGIKPTVIEKTVETKAEIPKPVDIAKAERPVEINKSNVEDELIMKLLKGETTIGEIFREKKVRA